MVESLEPLVGLSQQQCHEGDLQESSKFSSINSVLKIQSWMENATHNENRKKQEEGIENLMTTQYACYQWVSVCNIIGEENEPGVKSGRANTAT